MRVLIVLFATALVAVVAGATAHARSAQPPLVLHYPKAKAVPTGSRYLKATVSSWRSDASALSSSPSTMYVGNAVGLQRIDPAKNAFETPFVPRQPASYSFATAYANWQLLDEARPFRPWDLRDRRGPSAARGDRNPYQCHTVRRRDRERNRTCSIC